MAVGTSTSRKKKVNPKLPTNKFSTPAQPKANPRLETNKFSSSVTPQTQPSQPVPATPVEAQGATRGGTPAENLINANPAEASPVITGQRSTQSLTDRFISSAREAASLPTEIVGDANIPQAQPQQEGGFQNPVIAEPSNFNELLQLSTAASTSVGLTSLLGAKKASVGGLAEDSSQLGQFIYKTDQYAELGLGKVNNKVAKLTTSHVARKLGKFGLALSTIGLATSLIMNGMQTYQMNKWAKVDNVNFALNQAWKNAKLSGDEATLAEIEAMQDAITSDTFWSDLVPGEGMKVAQEAMRLQYDTQRQLEEDMALLQQTRNTGLENGLTTVTTEDGRVIQNTEDTNKNFFQELADLARERELNQRNEDAKFWEERRKKIEVEIREGNAEFWRKEKEKTFEREEEERIKTAKFWLNYKKTVLDMEEAAYKSRSSGSSSQQEDNSPSGLGFGLL